MWINSLVQSNSRVGRRNTPSRRRRGSDGRISRPLIRDGPFPTPGTQPSTPYFRVRTQAVNVIHHVALLARVSGARGLCPGSSPAGPVPRLAAPKAARPDHVSLHVPGVEVEGDQCRKDALYSRTASEIRSCRAGFPQRSVLHFMAGPQGDILLWRERLRQV